VSLPPLLALASMGGKIQIRIGSICVALPKVAKATKTDEDNFAQHMNITSIFY